MRVNETFNFVEKLLYLKFITFLGKNMNELKQFFFRPVNVLCAREKLNVFCTKFYNCQLISTELTLLEQKGRFIFVK